MDETLQFTQIVSILYLTDLQVVVAIAGGGAAGNITFIIKTIGIAINGVAVVVECHSECGSGTTGTRGVQGRLDSNFKFTVSGEFEELRRWNGECCGAE